MEAFGSKPLYYEREAPNLIHCGVCMEDHCIIPKGGTYAAYNGQLGHPRCIQAFMKLNPYVPPPPKETKPKVTATTALDTYGG